MSSPTSVSTDQFLHDVLRGLAEPEKSLPCKYFYDEIGCRLFEEICQTDEYYLTAHGIGPDAALCSRDGRSAGPELHGD